MNDLLKKINIFAGQILNGLRQVKTLHLSHIRKVFSLMGKREKIAVYLLLSLAAISLTLSVRNLYYSLTVPRPANGGSYTEGLFGQPSYINPILAHQEADISITRLVFSGLYKYDNSGNLAADLAEGMPTVSPDQKQYTVNLKRSALWHNHKPVNADDVIYTILLLKDSAYKSPYRNLWLATNVEKLSEFSVKFTTKDISAPFRENLTMPILPKSLWSRVEPQNFLLSNLNLEAIGSGPYAIKEIHKLPSGKIQELDLEAFADFYGGRPKLSKLTFKFYDTEDAMLNALHSGQINGFGFMPLGNNIYLDKNRDATNIFTLPLPQYQVLFLNLNNGFLNSQPVRKALSLGLDRGQIIAQVFKGSAVAAGSPLLFRQNRDAAPPDSDITQAGQILDSAGWKIDAKTNFRTNKKNQVLEITLATNDSLPNSKAAELVANQWRALNLKVTLTILPTKELTDTLIKPRKFDVLLFPQKFGADPDPFLFFHSSQIRDPGFNLTGFADPAADKLITEARTTTNQQLQSQKYQELANLLADRLPVIFLDETVFVYAVDKKVKNIGLKTIYEANQRFYDLPNWYTNEQRVWK